MYDVGCRRMNPTATLTNPAPTLNFVKQETPLILLDTGEYYILYSEINKNDSDKYLNTITAIYDLMDINLEKHITPYYVKNMEIYNLLKKTCNRIIPNGLKPLDVILEDVKDIIKYYSIEKSYKEVTENTKDNTINTITQTFSLNTNSITSYKGKEFASIDLYENPERQEGYWQSLQRRIKEDEKKDQELELVWNVSSRVAKTPTPGPSESYDESYQAFGQQYACLSNQDAQSTYENVVLYNIYYNITIVVNLKTNNLKYNTILKVINEFSEFILIDTITLTSEKDNNLCKDLFHKKYYEDSGILSKKIKSFIELYGYSKPKKEDFEKSHLSEKETILNILKSDFIINDDPACRMRAGELYELVTKYLLPDVTDGLLYRRRLQGYFMEAGLLKKRMSDGMYYYGIKHNIINKKEYIKDKIKGDDLIELTKNYKHLS